MNLLTYTPREIRTKSPDYDTTPVPRSYHVDCGWNWDNVYTGDGKPEPCIQVNAAEDDDYVSGTWEDFITTIEFSPTRECFKSAWRIARLLNRGNGHVVFSPREWAALRGPIMIWTGDRHKIFASDRPL